MSLKDFFTRRRLNRLQRDLNMLRDTIKFNPYAVAMIDSETDKDFSRRITEYRVWSMGNSYVLRRFFVGTLEYRTCNYFWTRAPLSYRMIHSGLPGLICSKMPRILFGNGIAPTVSVYKDSGEVDKNKTKAATDYTLQLIDKVKLRDVLTECATNESWGGHSFIKFSFDTDLSNFPIIEAADIMSTEVVKERNETVAIIFKTWYEDKKKGNQQRKYRLDEIYTTDATGDAVIRYELYELTTGEEKRVPLNSIPETQKIVEAVNSDDEVVFTGLKGMLAFEKPNKLPSLEFPHSNYGASDFEGATDSFDAVDEAYSTIINEIRDNRTFRYFASHNFRRDKDTGEILTPDDGFTKNFVLTEGDIDQEQGVNKNRIVDQIQIPILSVKGRVDGDRDSIGTAARNYNNTWESKQITNFRKWSTLVHPLDIDETNIVASIENITKVFNEEQKFKEKDCYLISKVYKDWTAQSKTADATAITASNILTVIDKLMENMTEKRVPTQGRILYLTPTMNTYLKSALQRRLTATDDVVRRQIEMLDDVEIVEVPSDCMKTAYTFTEGCEIATKAGQINLFLVHPSAVITPEKYNFVNLAEPTAVTEGKYYYYEESYEDVFILNKKADGIAFNITAAA